MGDLNRTDRVSRARFIWGMAMEFAFSGARSGAEALDYARDTYNAYIEEIGVEFGDASYVWTPSAGAEVARWMEIQYWERAA